MVGTKCFINTRSRLTSFDSGIKGHLFFSKTCVKEIYSERYLFFFFGILFQMFRFTSPSQKAKLTPHRSMWYEIK